MGSPSSRAASIASRASVAIRSAYGNRRRPAPVNVMPRLCRSNKAVPITSLAVRKGPFLGTISKFHGTSFDANGLTTSGRSERDGMRAVVRERVPGAPAGQAAE